MSPPLISVVVCTRNRAGPLGQLLASLASLHPPDSAWELVVVDNGSSDATPQVVAGFADRLPVRYTREERPGLSNARNHGVAVAQGRYLCWTDDDAVVDPDWLRAYEAAFHRHPEAAVFGGAITPRLEPPTPAWFARYAERWPLNGVIARRDFGPDPVRLDFDRDVTPWGVNFAIRAEEQRARRYDPELGVSPSHRRSSEETQLLFETLSDGAVGWWVPEARVFHLFPPHRQTRRYVFEHFAAIGEARAYLDATRKTHCMNRDGLQPRASRADAGRLAAGVALNKALAGLLRAAGLELRGLYHLRRAGLAAGALAYLRSAPPVS